MDKANIERIAKTPEDKVLLSKIHDKLSGGIRRNILASTGFLSPRELEMTHYMYSKADGIIAFGGYENAQRKILLYLPEYLDPDTIWEHDPPIACIRAKFFDGDSLSHRDFLGALMGSGIARECVGDICVDTGSCDFFVTAQIAPYILQNLSSAGHTKLHLEQVALSDARIPEEKTVQLCDTLASLRLDGIVASGFRISRTAAAQYITSGRAAIDGLPCEKPDKVVAEGMSISVKGYGKIKLTKINGLTKKGRISVVIDRYV